MTAIRTHRPHLVQTATVWGTWTDRPTLQAISPSEGAGQVIGSTTLIQRVGSIRQAGATGNPTAVVPLASLLGQWCRILLQDPVGVISAAGNTWTALWHGEISATQQPDDGGGMAEMQLQCLGLASALARLTCNYGFEKRWSASGSGPDNLTFPNYVPAFNAEPSGDMYTADVDIDGTGASCRCHSRGKVGSSVKWTAFHIVRTLLRAHARGQQFPSYSAVTPLTWIISDPQNLLNFEPINLDVSGMRLLDAINTVINPRRGLTWRHTVSGNTVTIVPESLTPTAITVGAFSLAANNRPVTPDLSTSHFIDQAVLTVDQGSAYDVIRAVGERPWVAITLTYTADGSYSLPIALVKGWTSPNENSWYTGGQVGIQPVFRRFTLADTWAGDNQDGTTNGLRQGVAIDGSRTHASGTSWNPQYLELSAQLPVSPEFSTLAKGPRQDAVAVMYNGNSYLPLTGGSKIDAYYQLPVQVESQPGAVWVGISDEDANKMEKFLAASTSRVYVTVGIREAAPLFVEWQRSPGSQPRDLPRTLTVRVPDCEQWIALAGTVTGCSADGTTLLTLPADVTARDDLGTLKQTLALLQAYYAQDAATIEWIDNGVIDTGTTYGPGALITTATLSTGVATVNATITTRTWDLSEDGFGTRYSSTRMFSPLDLYR